MRLLMSSPASGLQSARRHVVDGSATPLLRLRSRSGQRLGTLVDRHEGEWERITVDLKPDNTPRQVRYWVHDCEEPITVAWDGVPKVEETHPVVFSALGAHASYPDERDVPLEGLCPLPLGKKTKIALELMLGFDIDKVGQGAGDQTA